ncbi:glycosyltransferase family 2 protein [Candidatus Wolfebacteria bacterium]|nr:glycosyltransferase family 2 protein [Candidatus Wolfebacteria bacterium]
MSRINLYRFFETIPGILTWTTLILMFVFSWLAPIGAAIFIILFDLYWLLKTIYLSICLRNSFLKMRKKMKINWLQVLMGNQSSDIKNLPTQQFTNYNNKNLPTIKSWQDIYHLIVLPMYKEPYSVIKESFESLSKINYPKDKLIVVLVCEERAGETTIEIAKKIKQDFNDKFFKLITTTHPANIEGELPGKGSNQIWAVKEVKKSIIDPMAIPYENILISVFDADTQISADYFSILTHTFLTCPFPQHSSFQPIPLFINNIFQTPAFARVISFSSTFWHMVQQSRQERLTTFSSHSMPFKALVEVGFWNKDVVSEDSRIFWQCYLHYNGNWRVVPLFNSVSMDANVSTNFWKTMINQYKQQRRWSWGCENIPYFLSGFIKNKKIAFKKKLYWAFNTIESFHSWSTNALLIFALGWLPLFLGKGNFSSSMISYNLPQITKFIMTLAMIGIITSAILNIILLPPKPAWFKKRHYILYFFQWILMPITLIIFGAFPAIDAQTRLMLGGKFRLGFWFTPKHR